MAVLDGCFGGILEVDWQVTTPAGCIPRWVTDRHGKLTRTGRFFRFKRPEIEVNDPLQNPGLDRAKTDERATLLAMLDTAPVPVPDGQVIMADKGYNGVWLEKKLNAGGVELFSPARKGENPRPGRRFLKPLRQRIESVFATLKAS